MRSIISTIFIAMSLFVSAQEDVARNMISKTEVSIFKSQKEMLAGHVQNKQTALSNAIRYQVLAIEEFNKSNFSIAMCYSSKAREYTIEILSAVPNLSGLDYYLLTNEEQQMRMQNNCTASETATPVLISDAVLMSPDQLRNSYKISLN